VRGFEDRLDAPEQGFSVHREVLENGVRVVTLREVSPEASMERRDAEDISDGVIVVADAEDALPLQGLEHCIASLEEAVGKSNGQLTDAVQEAVLLTGQCLHAKIRGVCQAGEEVRPLPGDGVIYIPFSSEKSGEASRLRQTVDTILEQLNTYAEPRE